MRAAAARAHLRHEALCEVVNARMLEPEYTNEACDRLGLPADAIEDDAHYEAIRNEIWEMTEAGE